MRYSKTKCLVTLLTIACAGSFNNSVVAGGNEGANPPILKPQEEAAMAITQSYMDIVAAIATKIGCQKMAGVYSYNFNTESTGQGSGILSGTIRLSVNQNGLQKFSDNTQATKYFIYQPTPGWFFGEAVTNLISNYAFGINGHLLVGASQLKSGIQWRTVVVDEIEEKRGSLGRAVEGKGLEYVEGISPDLSTAKWRKQVNLIRPSVEDGLIKATATKISSTNQKTCQITLQAYYDDLDARVIVRNGKVIVMPM